MICKITNFLRIFFNRKKIRKIRILDLWLPEIPKISFASSIWQSSHSCLNKKLNNYHWLWHDRYNNKVDNDLQFYYLKDEYVSQMT